MKWQDLDHGTGSLASGYGIICSGMLVGLWRGRAKFGKYLAMPLMAIVFFIVAALITSLLSYFWSRAARGSTRYVVGEIIALAVFAFVGFAGGLGPAQSVADRKHLRGTRVVEGADALRPGATAGENSPLTFGGMPVLESDETKHFKLIGTTGTGKSTAIRALLVDFNILRQLFQQFVATATLCAAIGVD